MLFSFLKWCIYFYISFDLVYFAKDMGGEEGYKMFSWQIKDRNKLYMDFFFFIESLLKHIKMTYYHYLLRKKWEFSVLPFQVNMRHIKVKKNDDSEDMECRDFLCLSLKILVMEVFLYYNDWILFSVELITWTAICFLKIE